MRKLVLAVAVAMASGKAIALGLGDIQLHSSLNEPFSADIQLISDKPGELQGAVVRLAPQDAFSQAGIDWPAVLADLKFNVVQQGNSAVVKVTSSQPIREPFLDFIVQLQWPNGRLLREYTVLLDPPTFNGEKTAPAAPIASAPISSAPAPAPAVSPETSTEPSAKAKSAASAAVSSAPAPAPAQTSRPTAAPQRTAAPGSYGPTQRTDTAWAVANQVRPDSAITVHQAMLALLEANPDAFLDSNVNSMLAGHVLRVPARDVMAAIPARDAEREVHRQYQQWRQARSGGPVRPQASTPAAAKPSGEAAAAAPASTEQPSRLRLAAPGSSAAENPGAGGGQNIEKLRNDLSIALESADAARRENEELRSRLSALEGQINSMQRLLTLKDGTLADMQNQPGIPAPVPPASEGAVAPPAAEAPAVAPSTAAPAQPTSPTKPAAPAEPPAPSNDLFDNPALLVAAGGGVLLLLALAWLMARRRSEEREGEEARLEPILAEAAAEAAAAQAARKDTADEVTVSEEAPLSPQMGALAEEVAKSAEAEGAQTASNLDVMHTADGDIDPIVEADVYLAYRRYQQAEALIQTALAKQPQRLDLKVKLLEIYYAARDAESFRMLAESLHDELRQRPDDALWQRVVAMGVELLPDHALFASSASKGFGAAMATSGAGAALFAAGDATVADGELPPSSHEDFFGMDAHETEMTSGESSLDLDLNLGGPQDMDVAAGGNGLDDMMRGVPDLDLGNDAATSASRRSTDKEDAPTSASWQTEPALSDFGMDFNLDDADFLAGTDVVGTKLDLARAYIDMGDHDSARDILKEVMAEGDPQQKQEAEALSQQIV